MLVDGRTIFILMDPMELIEVGSEPIEVLMHLTIYMRETLTSIRPWFGNEEMFE